MRKELERKIREAHDRLEGGIFTEEERAENTRRQAVKDFMDFLAQRIDFDTRMELLRDADYFWQETAPAVKFELDGRVFILAQSGDQVCHLCDKTDNASPDLASVTALSPGDPHFQDRLLVAIDAMLKTETDQNCSSNLT